MSVSTVPRPAAVAAVLATSATWTPARRKSDGKPFYIVPGSRGAVYYTASDGCTCPAAQHSRDGRCKHTAAVLEHERRSRQVVGAEHTATASPTSWRPCSRGCGELLAPEHVGKSCDACWSKLAATLDFLEG